MYSERKIRRTRIPVSFTFKLSALAVIFILFEFFVTDQIDLTSLQSKKNSKVYLSKKQFLEQVNFKFGIPLIVLDFFDYMTGSDFISHIKVFENPRTHIERFNTQDNEY